MHWFVAILLYRSSSDAPDYTPLYQETFVVLTANSLDHARAKAESYGRSRQASYQNEYQETITWTLFRVVDVAHTLDEPIVDGAELYARHFRDYSAYQVVDAPDL